MFLSISECSHFFELLEQEGVLPTAPCLFYRHSWVFFLRNSDSHLELLLPSSLLSLTLLWDLLLFSVTLAPDLASLLPALSPLMPREFTFTLITLLVHWSSPFLDLSTLITLIWPLIMVPRVEITTFLSHRHPKLRCFLYSHIFLSFHLIESHPQWVSSWLWWHLPSWEPLCCLSVSQTFLSFSDMLTIGHYG